MSAMEQRWNALCDRVGVSERVSDTYLRIMAGSYSEPERHYHDLDHIRDVLDKLDWAVGALKDSGEYKNIHHPERFFDRVELALWFHDVIYRPLRNDNEEKSAEFFREFAGTGGLDEKTADDVARLIVATADHTSAAAFDEKLTCDCDLAILGASESRFRRYEEDIRREYAAVPAPMFEAGRKKLLKQFLDMDRIYHTDAFFTEFEAQARRNLHAALHGEAQAS